ncbi:MAG: M2 family metallopeptidase, partial [Sedimentisphaerales bacterium]
MKTLSTSIIISTISVVLFGCAHNVKETNMKGFIAAHVEKIKPMEKQASLASWNAAISGKPEDYDKVSELTLKVRQVYSNPEEFAFLKDMKESGQVKNAILARQLDVLYNSYLETQIEPKLLKKIVDLGTEIEKNFSTFRGTIEGEKVTDNEIKEILKIETNSHKREQAWLAGKQVGAVVADDIIQLVKLRNQAAQKL